MRNSKKQAEYIEFLKVSVLKFYKCSFNEFKKQPAITIFAKALKVQPTTKKAISKAFDLNIESMCRRKRELEQNGTLKQSTKKVICQCTGRYAHLLTTNSDLFNDKLYSDAKR